MGRKKKGVVGSRNTVHTAVAKPMFNLIVSFKKDLERKEKEKCKKKGKKYKDGNITFVYASLELSKILKNVKK